MRRQQWNCRMKMVALAFIAVAVALAFGSIPAQAQTVTATVAAGRTPGAMAVNPVTNKGQQQRNGD